MVQSMALVNLRHFVVEGDSDDIDVLASRFSFVGPKTLDVDLAALPRLNGTSSETFATVSFSTSFESSLATSLMMVPAVG